jgi:hypothetical protein
LLGWLAGTGRFSLDVPAGTDAAAAPVQPAKEPDRADQFAKDGKKPNIVFVLMEAKAAEHACAESLCD